VIDQWRVFASRATSVRVRTYPSFVVNVFSYPQVKLSRSFFSILADCILNDAFPAPSRFRKHMPSCVTALRSCKMAKLRNRRRGDQGLTCQRARRILPCLNLRRKAVDFHYHAEKIRQGSRLLGRNIGENTRSPSVGPTQKLSNGNDDATNKNRKTLSRQIHSRNRGMNVASHDDSYMTTRRHTGATRF